MDYEFESDGLYNFDDFYAIMKGYHDKISDRHFSGELDYNKAERCNDKLNEWIQRFYDMKIKSKSNGGKK